MLGLTGVTRIYLRHAAILLALGGVLQLASAHTLRQAGAQRSLGFARDKAAPLHVAPDTPKRPRITGIDHVRLYVANRNKSTEFYGKFFGPPTKTAYGCRTASHPCFPVW